MGQLCDVHAVLVYLQLPYGGDIVNILLISSVEDQFKKKKGKPAKLEVY